MGVAGSAGLMSATSNAGGAADGWAGGCAKDAPANRIVNTARAGICQVLDLMVS